MKYNPDMKVGIMKKVMHSDLWQELSHDEKRMVRFMAGQIPKKPGKRKNQECRTPSTTESGSGRKKKPRSKKPQMA